MGEEQPKHVEPETFPQEKTPNHDSYEKALVPIEKPIYIAESILSLSIFIHAHTHTRTAYLISPLKRFIFLFLEYLGYPRFLFIMYLL